LAPSNGTGNSTDVRPSQLLIANAFNLVVNTDQPGTLLVSIFSGYGIDPSNVGTQDLFDIDFKVIGPSTGGGTIIDLADADPNTGIVTQITANSLDQYVLSPTPTIAPVGGPAGPEDAVVVSTGVAPQFTSGPPTSPVSVGTPYSFTFTATGAPAPTFG